MRFIRVSDCGDSVQGLVHLLNGGQHFYLDEGSWDEPSLSESSPAREPEEPCQEVIERLSVTPLRLSGSLRSRA